MLTTIRTPAMNGVDSDASEFAEHVTESVERHAEPNAENRPQPNIAVIVQHHPNRADLLPDLLLALGDAIVIPDIDPQGFPHPWRCYQACLEAASDLPHATHACILQDDVTPCRAFREALAAAVAARPDRVLVLFHGGAPRQNVLRLTRALASGETWVELAASPWVPAVAVVWPIRLVCPVVCWVEEQEYPRGFKADDEIIGRALRAFDETVLVCVPSIIQHEDVVPSLAGQKARGGADPNRVAAYWIGDGDPLELDWDSGAA